MNMRINSRGLTMVELLVVVGMLSLVLTAIYSVYISHMKITFSQEEVIDVQQNLRLALDSISQDLTMAGVMVPTGTNAIPSPSGSPPFPNYSTSIRLTTTSAACRFARVVNAATAGTLTVQVDPAAKAGATPAPVDGFAAGDQVRVVHPVDGSTSSTCLTVAATDRTNDTVTFTSGLPESAAAGDMLAKTADDSPLPHTVDYFLIDGGGPPVNGFACPKNQKCLVRQVNGSKPVPLISQDIIATNLTSVRFTYLNDSYAEETVPADPARVRAVRVTLKGATTKTILSFGAVRSRSMTSIIKLRNRR